MYVSYVCQNWRVKWTFKIKYERHLGDIMCKRAMYLACMRVHLLVNCTTEHNSISNVNYAVSSRKSHLKGIQCFDLMLDYDKWIIWISGVVGISNNLHNYTKKNNLSKQTFFSPTKVFRWKRNFSDGNEIFLMETNFFFDRNNNFWCYQKCSSQT